MVFCQVPRLRDPKLPTALPQLLGHRPGNMSIVLSCLACRFYSILLNGPLKFYTEAHNVPKLSSIPRQPILYTASLSVVSEREVQDVWRGRYAILPNVRGREETSGKSEKLRIFQCDLLQAKLNPLRPSRSTQCAQCSRPRCPARFPTSGRPAGSRTTTGSASSHRTSSMRRSTSSSGEWVDSRGVMIPFLMESELESESYSWWFMIPELISPGNHTRG